MQGAKAKNLNMYYRSLQCFLYDVFNYLISLSRFIKTFSQERGGRLHHTASLSADSEFQTADLLIELNKCRTIVLRSYDCDTQQTHATSVQAQTVPPLASVGAQPAPVQLLAEAKHLRDFRKYNLKTFDGSMDNSTKAQMWLTSIEKIFRYMKSPEDQKVQCAVFFLDDRGTAWWETVERMLDKMKDEEARTEKFVRGLSLHERADPSKAIGRGSALGQKRKVESQPDLTP
ncbi:gag-protease polyprotein [Cucumis melo var. makuwa]|uniref:Gag-protease polyprotein n=1 Tax=Cucumis melo var. makuwa TaxID=1194695 RepID=A0A5A7UXF7_CUCMM|nr:gag-protease polyprotein [Cucumis melo var. makuwa]